MLYKNRKLWMQRKYSIRRSGQTGKNYTLRAVLLAALMLIVAGAIHACYHWGGSQKPENTGAATSGEQYSGEHLATCETALAEDLQRKREEAWQKLRSEAEARQRARATSRRQREMEDKTDDV